jgi:SAM-dependent methyltransferase
MFSYQRLKRAVPLEWKVGFHDCKTRLRHAAARFKIRLEGHPAIPPGDFIYLVVGHRDPRQFLESGRATNEAIRRLLGKHDLKVAELGAVLDFGCGVGRIMRHWRTTTGPAWHGTDYNPALVEWCKRHLKFADFRVNALSGELPYPAHTFDLIYAFSVFTHLGEPLQFFWINELSRVLKPGGYIWLTTHGENYLGILTPEELKEFRRGQLVIREGAQSGSNFCAVFHPVSYVHEMMAKELTVIDFLPGGEHGDVAQDVHLLRKPPGQGNLPWPQAPRPNQ